MPTNERMEAVRVVGLRRQPDEPLVRIHINLEFFENILKMSYDTEYSKDKIIQGKIFSKFFQTILVCKFLNWIPQKLRILEDG